LKKILTLAIISLLVLSVFSFASKAQVEFVAEYGGYGIKGEWETLGTASAYLIFADNEGWGWIMLGEDKYNIVALKEYVIEKEGELSIIYEGHLLENDGKVRFAVYRDVIVGEVVINGVTYSFGVAQTLESGIFVLDEWNEHLEEQGFEEGLIETPPFLDVYVPSNYVPAVIDFDPDTLNLKSKGEWVTVYIELLGGYNVYNIDIGTIKLNGIVPAENNQKYGFVRSRIGDYDQDGILDCMVKFNRTSVQEILEPGDMVRIEITGSLVGGTPFYGVDWIKVIGKNIEASTNPQSTSQQGDCPLYVQENAVFMTNMDVIPVSHSFVESPEGMPLLEISPEEESFTLNINFYINDSSTAAFIKILYCNNTVIYRGSVPSSILSVGWNTLTVTLPRPIDGEIHGVRIVGVAGHRDDDGVSPWNGVLDETFGTREEDWNIALGDGYFVGKAAEDLGWYEYEVAYQFTLKIPGLVSHNPFISSLSLTPSKTTLSPGETFTVTAKYYRYSYCPSDYFKFLCKNEATGAMSEIGRWAAGYWQMVPYGWQTFTITLRSPTVAGTYTVKAVGCSGHGEWPYYYDVRWDVARSDGGFRGYKPEEMTWDFNEISAEFTITVAPEERIVSVYAAADKEYMDYYDNWWNPWDSDQWISEIRRAVELGDDAFEREFRINFIIRGIGTWDSTDGVHDYARLWEEAWREIDKGENDIKVAFTGQIMRDHEGNRIPGAALYDTVIVNPVRRSQVDNLHQHEYSHLFGAPDHGWVREIRCIMSYAWAWEINDWCTDCRSTISTNKWMEFKASQNYPDC